MVFEFLSIPLFVLFSPPSNANYSRDYIPRVRIEDPTDVISAFQFPEFVKKRRIRSVRSVYKNSYSGLTFHYYFSKEGLLDSTVYSSKNRKEEVAHYKNGERTELFDFRNNKHYRYNKYETIGDSLTNANVFFQNKRFYDPSGFLIKEIYYYNRDNKYADSLLYVNDAEGRPVEIRKFEGKNTISEYRTYNSRGLLSECTRTNTHQRSVYWYYGYNSRDQLEFMFHGDAGYRHLNLAQYSVSDTAFLKNHCLQMRF